jgi:hypothetical protein
VCDGSAERSRAAAVGPTATRRDPAPQEGAPVCNTAFRGECQEVEAAIGDAAIETTPAVRPETALDVVAVIGA